jgi:hypothetical protein
MRDKEPIKPLTKLSPYCSRMQRWIHAKSTKIAIFPHESDRNVFGLYERVFFAISHSA